MRDLISRLEGTRLLCLGDLMLDRFVEGKVVRISPEAPVPVLSAVSQRDMLGGAGNVGRNATALGGLVDLVAVVGRDDAGRHVGALAAEVQGLSAHLILDQTRPTTLKTRFQAAGQQLLRVDGEALEPISEAVEEGVLAALDALVPTADVVVLSDYAKGLLTDRVIRAAIAAAAAAGVPVLVDPKSRDLRRYQGAAVVTPNLRELEDVVGRRLPGDGPIVDGAKEVLSAGAFQAVLVTRSEHGMSLVQADGTAHHERARAREVFDVAGAGDTVIAAFALATGAGADLASATALANAAAGIVVGKAGTATVNVTELAAALGETAPPKGGVAKDMAAAVGQVMTWRQRGEKVGFTNGCFDLLHPGHVRTIDQTRSHCDRLVVGVNSDASVSRLKGPGRPVTSEQDRAAVLAALRSVDLVVIFDEDTPLRLIEALQPDLIAKGGDYTPDQVVGAEVVRARGGDVLIVPLVEGLSTTRTLARVVG